MNSLSLILRILAIVAALAAAAFFFVSKGQLAEQQDAQQQAEQATVTIQAELTTANDQVSALAGRLNSEREALADAKRKLESVRSEMYTAKQEVRRSQQQLSEANRNIDSLESDAKRLRSDLIKSEEGLAAANKQGEIAQLKERVAELEKSNADLTESLEDAKVRSSSAARSSGGNTGTLASGGRYSTNFSPTASQPLPTASIGSKTTIQSLSAKNGLIVLANKPELGMAPGVEVTLIRDLKALGKVQVVRVTEDLIVANILPGAKTREMTAGATVSLLR
jgi:peptidoglycan hydrolase CwlO-like protein